MNFNPAPPVIMHVDINSCFATIEQQANPLLRGKPVVVAAYTTNNGCVLAASREAKKIGIKTGKRVKDAKYMYPRLVVLPADPSKYRVVNEQLTTLLLSYSPNLSVESIDEMVLSLADTPVLHKAFYKHKTVLESMIYIARDMKRRIQEEIGEWITVSIGISTNQYLAKVASGLEKPDGLRWITHENIEEILSGMKLEDLCGIKEGNANRLRSVGVYSAIAMYQSSSDTLKWGFHSIVGIQWWLRIHGYEDGGRYKTLEEKQVAAKHKTYGQSYAMRQFLLPTDSSVWQILSQLVMKMGTRLRLNRCSARGAYISLLFEDHCFWHAQELQRDPLFADSDFYKKMMILLQKAPEKPIRMLAISCYQLHKDLYDQQSLLADENKKQVLTKAIDAVQEKFGSYMIIPARMVGMESRVMDRIAFGKAGLSANVLS